MSHSLSVLWYHGQTGRAASSFLLGVDHVFGMSKQALVSSTCAWQTTFWRPRCHYNNCQSFCCRWLDGSPNTWEFEDHLSPALISAFESGDETAFQQLALPQSMQDEKVVSKRAARRLRKQARREAQAENGSAASNGSSRVSSGQNGSSVNEHNDQATTRLPKAEGDNAGASEQKEDQSNEVREVVRV